MKKSIIILILSFLMFFSFSALLYAQPAPPVQNQANGHWYQLIYGDCMTWDQARNYSTTLSHNGLRGHLATVTSSQENDFIRATFFPFGGTDEIHAWIGGSQLSGQSLPESGWRWITGETWSFIGWGGGEPNDCCNPAGPPQETDEENCLEYKEDPSDNVFWNDANCDNCLNYIVIEYEQQAQGQAVPTMTEWGMIIFIVLAGLASVYYLRRQRRA